MEKTNNISLPTLLLWQLNIGKKTLFKIFGISLVVNFILLTIMSFIMGGGLKEGMPASMGGLVHVSFSYSLMSVLLMVSLTLVARLIYHRQYGIQFMMIPSRQWVKFAMRIIYLSVVIGLAFLLGFAVADLLQYAVVSWIGGPSSFTTPDLIECIQRSFTSVSGPGENAEVLIKGMKASMMQGADEQPDMSFLTDMLSVRSFAEAGIIPVIYGVSNILFLMALYVLCGLMFKYIGWLVAYLASVVVMITTGLVDYLLGLGQVPFTILYIVLFVIIIRYAYNIFKKKEVINNRFVDV